MNSFRLLHVEDDEQEREICKDAVLRYSGEKNRPLEIVECKDLDEAFAKLDDAFDGAIVDLKLAEKGNEGNQIIRKIEEQRLWLPIFILTGTPDAVEVSPSIEICKKGESDYVDLFEKFWEIKNTGLTHIMGGKGVLEDCLYRVYKNSLLPQLESWLQYGKKYPERSEKSLLRYTLNHLLHLLDNDNFPCFPEEVYLNPPLSKSLQTGSVVKEKAGARSFVVLNPACDLVIRDDGKCKTDKILVVEIEPHAQHFPCMSASSISESKRKALKKICKNSGPLYYHWLPKTSFFDGGLLNFRKLSSLSHDEIDGDFEKSLIQISPAFIKDIVARFSIYYARQGQPEIEIEDMFP